MRFRALIVLVIGSLVGTLVASPAVLAAESTTYEGHIYPLGISTPTADKPQSKVWFAADTWWAAMVPEEGNSVNVHRLEADHRWVDTGVVLDANKASNADILPEPGNVVSASRIANGNMKVNKLALDAQAGTYRQVSGFPVTLPTGGSESASIGRDPAGRLWVTYTRSSTVYVAWTLGGDNLWSAPVPVPVADSSVTADDISAIAATPSGIGVMWSDQQSEAIRFAVHDAAADPSQGWTLETPVQGPGAADDHLNLKSLDSDGSGRVFAVIKTSKNDLAGASPDDPILEVLVRDRDGNWMVSVAARVSDQMTRGQIVVDTEGTLHMMATAPEAGGVVYRKTADIDNPVFVEGRGEPFIAWPGAVINNVSTTKQTLNQQSGLVAIAADDATRRYYHAEAPVGPPPPPDVVAPSAPTGVSATATSATGVTVSWEPASDDVGVVAYAVLRNGEQVGTASATEYSDSGLSPATEYVYSVVALDAAGNRSAESEPVRVTTPEGQDRVLFRAASQAAGESAEVTVDRPVGVEAGDAVVVSLDMRGKPRVGSVPGWQVLASDVVGNTMTKVTLLRIATAAEPAAYTFPLSRSESWTAVAQAYLGVSQQDPVLSVGRASSSSGSELIGEPGEAPALAAVVGLFGIANEAALTPAEPLAERAEISMADARYRVSSMGGDTATSSAAVVPVSATSTRSAAYVVHTLVLQPE